MSLQTWPSYHLLHKREKPHNKKEEMDATAAAVVMKMMTTVMMIVVAMVMIRIILIDANHQVLRMYQAPTHSLSTHYPLES